VFDTTTVTSIKTAITSAMSTDIDMREGSYTDDQIGPVSLEMYKVYQSMNAIVPIAYIDETSGEYIDKRCDDISMVRQGGTKATVTLIFGGVDGTVVPAGKVFLTQDGLEFETDEAVTIADEAASVAATAVEAGVKYNVNAGTITVQYNNIIGLYSVTNGAAATGGIDTETDAALVERYYLRRRKRPASGNVADYESWALDVSGVGGAKAKALAYGPGTVGVVITNSDKLPVETSVVNACAAYIETVRPVGAQVAVESAQGVTANISVSVKLATGYTAAIVKALFEPKVTAYFKEAVTNFQATGSAYEGYAVFYNYIAYLLISTGGVTNYKNFIVNDGVADIALTNRQVPVLGTVTVNLWT